MPPLTSALRVVDGSALGYTTTPPSPSTSKTKTGHTSTAQVACESSQTKPPGHEEEGYCALVLKTMYGTEDAAAVW